MPSPTATTMPPVPPITDPITAGGLCRLLTWLSPAFPVGGFSYSHGLEFAVEAGLVTSAGHLRTWIDAILRHGSGRSDAILLAEAWRAERDRDREHAVAVAELADAFRGTAELALESRAQGKAFLDAVDAGWPDPHLAAYRALLLAIERPPAYSCVVGVSAAVSEIALIPALLAYLQAFAANLVSAGVRLIPLGQSAGLAVLVALEPAIIAVAEATPGRSLDAIATSTWMVDWASAGHETQYTRLFRS